MRNAFATELTALAGRDERLVLLSGDIGNKLFDEFKARFPARFVNCGVAEANMMSVAAGLALCGLRPVTYTIASFATMRCLEQIRIDACYHNLPIVLAARVRRGSAWAPPGVRCRMARISKMFSRWCAASLNWAWRCAAHSVCSTKRRPNAWPAPA